MSLKGKQTEKNLADSFIGETFAAKRYLSFAKKAKKEGYEQVAAVFEETSFNETQHAKLFLSSLGSNSQVSIQLKFPNLKVGTTLENLKTAAAGENEEHTKIYPQFAATADKEGFSNIGELYRQIASVEALHEARYKALAKQIETNTIFTKSKAVKWKCRNCGFVVEATEAPAACPLCSYPQGFFEIKEVWE